MKQLQIMKHICIYRQEPMHSTRCWNKSQKRENFLFCPQKVDNSPGLFCNPVSHTDICSYICHCKINSPCGSQRRVQPGQQTSTTQCTVRNSWPHGQGICWLLPKHLPWVIAILEASDQPTRSSWYQRNPQAGGCCSTSFLHSKHFLKIISKGTYKVKY